MSGLGPGDMGEVEQTAALFVQRGDAGPPGGSGPGSPDKNKITLVGCGDGSPICADIDCV